MNVLFLINIFFMMLCLGFHYNKSNFPNYGLIFIGILLITVRGFVVPFSVLDMQFYTYIYETVSSLNLTQLHLYITISEPGYVFVNYICSLISKDFNFFLLLYNIFLFYSYYRFIRSFSNSPYLSCLFAVLIILNQSVYVIRQHLAIAVVLFSYNAIINKRLVRYILIMLCACSIHYSAIIWFPIYFVVNASSRKIYFLLLMLSTVFIFAYFSSFAYIAGEINEKYQQSYLSVGSQGATYTNALIEFCILISAIIFFKDKLFKERRTRLLATAVFLAAVFDIAGIKIELISRLTLYYSVADIILLANISHSIKDKTIKNLYLGIVIILFFVIFNGNYQKGMGLHNFDVKIHNIL